MPNGEASRTRSRDCKIQIFHVSFSRIDFLYMSVSYATKYLTHTPTTPGISSIIVCMCFFPFNIERYFKWKEILSRFASIRQCGSHYLGLTWHEGASKHDRYIERVFCVYVWVFFSPVKPFGSTRFFVLYAQWVCNCCIYTSCEACLYSVIMVSACCFQKLLTPPPFSR